MPIKHKFVSPHQDGTDASKLQPSNWNDSHEFSGGTNKQFLVFDDAEADGFRWSSVLEIGNPETVANSLLTVGDPAKVRVTIDQAATQTGTYALHIGKNSESGQAHGIAFDLDDVTLWEIGVDAGDSEMVLLSAWTANPTTGDIFRVSADRKFVLGNKGIGSPAAYDSLFTFKPELGLHGVRVAGMDTDDTKAFWVELGSKVIDAFSVVRAGDAPEGWLHFGHVNPVSDWRIGMRGNKDTAYGLEIRHGDGETATTASLPGALAFAIASDNSVTIPQLGGTGSRVLSANTNGKLVVAAWADIPKTGSSLADLATRAVANLSDGSNVPLKNAGNIFTAGQFIRQPASGWTDGLNICDSTGTNKWHFAMGASLELYVGLNSTLKVLVQNDGSVTIPQLAGTGTRALYVDSNGKLTITPP